MTQLHLVLKSCFLWHYLLVYCGFICTVTTRSEYDKGGKCTKSGIKCSKTALKQKEKPVVYSQINMVKRFSKAISTEKVIFCYIKQFIYLFFPGKEPRIDSNQPHDLPTTRVVILLLQASMLLYYRKRKTLFLP